MKGIDPSWVHLNRFFTPRARGVKIANFAIVPERGALPFRPFGDLFACIFRRGSRPSRAAAFVFPALGDVDAFHLLLAPHSWYVCFTCLTHYSRILYIVWSWLSSPIHYEYCWVPPCEFFFVGRQIGPWTAPPGSHSHKQVWSLNFHLFLWDSAHSYAFKVSTSCSIEVFH